jgi:hypothetical protein
LSLITAFVFTYQGILNLTPDDNLLTAYVYVAYRSQHPDETTVKDVLKELKKNKIDICQLVEYRRDHCQCDQLSTEEVPLRDTGVGNGRQASAILNILDN